VVPERRRAALVENTLSDIRGHDMFNTLLQRLAPVTRRPIRWQALRRLVQEGNLQIDRIGVQPTIEEQTIADERHAAARAERNASAVHRDLRPVPRHPRRIRRLAAERH
jgi:hypothetical protein